MCLIRVPMPEEESLPTLNERKLRQQMTEIVAAVTRAHDGETVEGATCPQCGAGVIRKFSSGAWYRACQGAAADDPLCSWHERDTAMEKQALIEQELRWNRAHPEVIDELF